MCKLSVRSGRFQMDTPVTQNTRRAVPRKYSRPPIHKPLNPKPLAPNLKWTRRSRKIRAARCYMIVARCVWWRGVTRRTTGEKKEAGAPSGCDSDAGVLGHRYIRPRSPHPHPAKPRSASSCTALTAFASSCRPPLPPGLVAHGVCAVGGQCSLDAESGRNTRWAGEVYISVWKGVGGKVD